MLPDRRGFSIVGVIVAAGMLGGLALFLANITREQHVTQRKAETGVEITALHRKILSVLYDGEACTVTLGPDSFLPLGTSTRSLTQLKNKAGTAVVETGVEVNNLLEVESITLKNARGSTGLTREVDMEFVIKKTSKAITGYDKHVKTYPLTVELKSLPNTIARCHHTLDAKEEGIKEAMCIGLGGAFAAASGSVPSTCSLDALFAQYCISMGGTPYPGTPVGTCDIASVYVDVSGDTMTGALKVTRLTGTELNISGNISAGGRVSAGGGIPSPTPTAPVGANCIVQRGVVSFRYPSATCSSYTESRMINEYKRAFQNMPTRYCPLPYTKMEPPFEYSCTGLARFGGGSYHVLKYRCCQ